MKKMVCGGGEYLSNVSKYNSLFQFKAMHLVSSPNGISALKRLPLHSVPQPNCLTQNSSTSLGF